MREITVGAGDSARGKNGLTGIGIRNRQATRRGEFATAHTGILGHTTGIDTADDRRIVCSGNRNDHIMGRAVRRAHRDRVGQGRPRGKRLDRGLGVVGGIEPGTGGIDGDGAIGTDDGAGD